jgi:hypothetical protein
MEARECVEKIRAAGYTDSRVERVLELPRRTLAKAHETNQVTEEVMLALLRTLATYPFMIRVAESGFDANFAQEMLKIEKSIHLLREMQYV